MVVREKIEESINSKRFSRAESWIERSKSFPDDLQNAQMKFICLWIGFESLFGQAKTVHKKTLYSPALARRSKPRSKSKEDFDNFRDRIFKLGEPKIKDVFDKCAGDICKLINLRYVYPDFWREMYNFRPEKERNWEDKFNKDVNKYEKGEMSVIEIFNAVFLRLGVARNQNIHGAATIPSKRGGSQVRYGIAILQELVPCMMEIMKESGDYWGDIPYPHAGAFADDPIGKPPKPTS